MANKFNTNNIFPNAFISEISINVDKGKYHIFSRSSRAIVLHDDSLMNVYGHCTLFYSDFPKNKTFAEKLEKSVPSLLNSLVQDVHFEVSKQKIMDIKSTENWLNVQLKNFKKGTVYILLPNTKKRFGKCLPNRSYLSDGFYGE